MTNDVRGGFSYHHFGFPYVGFILEASLERRAQSSPHNPETWP